MTISVVVIGAGGHAAVVIEAMQAAGGFDLLGVLDPHPQADSVLGVPVIGGDADLPRLQRDGLQGVVIALGANGLRCKIAAQASALGLALPPVIHPSALISPSATISAGAVIMARAVIGSRTVIGPLAIVNTGAVVDHDNRIEEASHVAPGCALAGNVRVGRRTLVGVGSAVRPGIVIGANVTVGAGSAVVADIPDGATVGGAPAKNLVKRAIETGCGA